MSGDGDPRTYQGNQVSVTRVENGWLVDITLWDQRVPLIATTLPEVKAILDRVEWRAWAPQSYGMGGGVMPTQAAPPMTR